MKYTYFILFLIIACFSCRKKLEKDNFSGTWLAISSNVNGDRKMPEDTIQGVMKITDKNKRTYFFQLFETRFLLDQIDADSLVGSNVSVKYIEKSGHIIFDIGNGRIEKGYLGATGESIFEFKKIN
jgi:hypothetical protein